MVLIIELIEYLIPINLDIKALLLGEEPWKKWKKIFLGGRYPKSLRLEICSLFIYGEVDL